MKGEKLDSIYQKRPWLQTYPDWIPADIPVPGNTALDDFQKSAAERPDKPAIFYFDRTISYGELATLSGKLAAALSAWGIKKGDRVMVVLQNIPQFLIALYGAWKIGAIVVPLNPMYKEKELTYFCQDSGIRILIIQDDVANELDLEFLKQTPVERVITTSALDLLPAQGQTPPLLKDLKKITLPGTVDLLDLNQSTPTNQPGPTGSFSPGRRLSDLHLRDHRPAQGGHEHPWEHRLQCPGLSGLSPHDHR